MKLTAAFLLSILIIFSTFTPAEAILGRGNGFRRKVRLQKRQENLKEMLDGSIEFPSELKYTINIEGEGIRDLDLAVNSYIQMPRENGKRKRKYAFYTDVNTGDSFACKAKREKGKVQCDIAGIIEKNNETCYISPNSNTSDCEYSDDISDGQLLALDDNNQIVKSVAFQSDNNPNTSRERRSIFPDPGFKVIEIVYVGDKAFMLPFYNRNPGDDVAAEEEAELFVTLLANEMSVYYRSVKEVSSGQLEIVIYPAAFIHAGKGNNFAWSENNRRNSDTELDINDGLSEFLKYTNSDLNIIHFDHAMAITGLDLYISGAIGSRLLSASYTKTVCRPNSPKVSMQENIGYNLGWIASDVLGRALGYGLEERNICPSLPHIRNFTNCSVNAFISHLNSYPDCTANNGFTDDEFRESFCSGLLGAADMSLDRQCQTRTGSTTASVCNTTIPVDACYLSNQVSCRSTPTGSCSTSLLHVWNGTPCTGTGNICYRANCVSEFHMCPAESTQASTTTTSTIAPTTTTSTQAPTTTTSTQTPTTTTSTQTPSPPTPRPSCSCCGLRRLRRFGCCILKRIKLRIVCKCCYGYKN